MALTGASKVVRWLPHRCCGRVTQMKASHDQAPIGSASTSTVATIVIGMGVTQKGGNFLYGIPGDATTGDIGRVSREVVAGPLDDNRVSQVCAPSPYIRAKSLPAFG